MLAGLVVLAWGGIWSGGGFLNEAWALHETSGPVGCVCSMRTGHGVILCVAHSKPGRTAGRGCVALHLHP